MVDPFTPRNEPEGICANLNSDTFVKYATRGGNDVAAALKVLKATPGVDPNRIFLQGYSWGAISSLFAMDPNTPSVHDAKIADLVAYYPNCYDKVEFSTPTLVLIGDKDDWTPAKLCEADEGKRIWKSLFFRARPTPSMCHSRSQWTTSGTTSSMTRRRRGRRRRTLTPSWMRI